MTYRSGMPLLFHTADVHIGDSRNLPGYLDRQEKMLYEFTRICIEREIDVAVYVGDIFDAKYMKPREKDMFLKWFIENDRAAAKNDFDVVIQNGNHDEIEAGYTHLHSHKILQDYGMLKRTKIVEAEPKMLGPFKGTIWVASLPAQKYKKDEINVVVGAMRKKLDAKLEKAGKQTAIPGTEQSIHFVAMVHESIYGAENELGTWKVERGPKLDPDLPVVYWALGDIHKPFQQVMANAWYPGSPIQHEFGDVATERGVLIVDLDNPTEPEPVHLRGIVPLITLSAIPKKWPKDAIVRFEGTPQEISDTVFPDNVVGFKPVVDDVVASVIDTEGHDLLDELPEVLASQNVPSEFHDEIFDVVKDTMGAL